jgi:hypothetical protein
MRNLLTTAIVLLLTVTSHADAASYWGACDGCSSRQQIRAAIRTAPANTVGWHDVYLMDFERGSVQKYRVTTLYEPRDGGYMSAAIKVSTEAHIRYEFEQSVAAIKADIESFEAGTKIPEEVVGSAFDIVNSTVQQERVADYVNDNLNFWQAIGAPVSVPLAALGKIVNLNLFISVTFSDGSTAKLQLTGLEGSFTSISYSFELMKGSARDADGNLIPDSAAEAAPYYGVFSTEPFADQMVDFIIRWYAQGGAQVDCRSEASSGGVTVTCKRR